MAQFRITQAFLSSISSESNYFSTPGTQVQLYHEKDRTVYGPCKLLKVEGKQMYIDLNGTLVEHKLSNLIPELLYSGKGQLLLVQNALRSSA